MHTNKYVYARLQRLSLVSYHLQHTHTLTYIDRDWKVKPASAYVSIREHT